MDERFTSLINELTSISKEYTKREIMLKGLRVLPKEWDMRTIAVNTNGSPDEKVQEVHEKELQATRNHKHVQNLQNR